MKFQWQVLEVLSKYLHVEMSSKAIKKIGNIAMVTKIVNNQPVASTCSCWEHMPSCWKGEVIHWQIHWEKEEPKWLSQGRCLYVSKHDYEGKNSPPLAKGHRNGVPFWLFFSVYISIICLKSGEPCHPKKPSYSPSSAIDILWRYFVPWMSHDPLWIFFSAAAGLL